jgi:hypothetical protein
MTSFTKRVHFMIINNVVINLQEFLCARIPIVIFLINVISRSLLYILIPLSINRDEICNFTIFIS